MCLTDKKRLFKFMVLVGVFVMVPFFLSRGEETAPVSSQPALQESPESLGDKVIKRIPKLEMYPCTDCHGTAADFNTTQRQLVEEHDDKGVHYAKANDERWCHSCHMEGNYLKLKLLSGREVNLNEGYLVCGQCHSTQYRDWFHNAHGKRIGNWNGPRQIYSCPECHNPHQPPFKLMESKKPPVHPEGNFWKL